MLNHTLPAQVALDAIMVLVFIIMVLHNDELVEFEDAIKTALRKKRLNSEVVLVLVNNEEITVNVENLPSNIYRTLRKANKKWTKRTDSKWYKIIRYFEDVIKEEDSRKVSIRTISFR